MPRNASRAAGLLAIVTLASTGPGAVLAEYEFQKIVDASILMPGSDSRFQSFSQGVLAREESIFFTGFSCDTSDTLSPPCSVTGLYSVTPSGLEKIFDNSDHAPGTGTTFTNFASPDWADGRLAFGASFSAGGRGIYLRTGSHTELLATGSDTFNPLPTADFKTIRDIELTDRYLALVASPPPPLGLPRNLYIIHPDHFELSFEGGSGSAFEPSQVHIVDDFAFIAGSLSTDVYIHDLQTNTTVRILRGGDPLPNGEEAFHEFLLPTGDSEGIFFLAWISDGFPISANPPKGVFEIEEGKIKTLVRSDESAPGGGSFGHFNGLLGASGRWILDTGDPDTPGAIYHGSDRVLARVIGEGDTLDDRPINGVVPLDFDGQRLLLRVLFGSGDEALYLAHESSAIEVPALGVSGALLLSFLLCVGALALIGHLFGRGTG